MSDDGPLLPQTLTDLQAAGEAEGLTVGLAECWPCLEPHCRPGIRLLLRLDSHEHEAGMM